MSDQEPDFTWTKENANSGDCPSDPDFPAQSKYTVKLGEKRTVYSDEDGNFKQGSTSWTMTEDAWKKLTRRLRESELKAD